ncbi:MAG: hypothetical protein KF680_09940 [Cryobacterium sp.]|nr:hypothetical protein [Cryobacterium sp.]
MTPEPRTTTGSLSLWRRVWDLGYVLAGVAVATVLAWPIYDSARVIVVSVVAATLGIGIVLLAAKLRWTWWLTTLVAVGSFLVLVVPVAIPSALTSPMRILRGVLDGAAGVALGWKQLLTLSLPVGDYQGVLVPLFVTLLVGSLAAMGLALSNRAVSGFAVPVVLLMASFGLVFGSSEMAAPLTIAGFTIPAAQPVLLGILLVLVSLAWLVARGRMARSAALRLAQAHSGDVRQNTRSSFWVRLRRQAAAAILVIVAVAAGVVVAPTAATWVPRDTLREHVDPRLIVTQQPSPLASYRSWFSGESYDTEVFRIDGDLAGFDRVRIAVLGSYDGAVFRAGSGSASQEFYRLPASSGAGVPLTVTVGEGYSGVWLPIPGSIDSAPVFGGERGEQLADSFYTSANGNGSVVVLARDDGGFGVRPGDSYQVIAGPETDSRSLGATPGGEALISDDAHPRLAAWVEQQELPRTGEGLLQAIQRLRDRGYLSHSLQDDTRSEGWITRLAIDDYVFQPSYAGHSTARVEEMFTALYDQQRAAGADAPPDALVAAVGDDEQFATAAALLARYFGFDSRVVIGTRLQPAETAPSVPPCVNGSCTGANVSAWIEVRSATGAWVSIDASPQYELAPFFVNPGEERPENPTVVQTLTTEVLDPPPAQRDESTAASSDESAEPGWLESILTILRPIATGLLVATLLLLPALFLLGVKALRRNRRRAAPVPEVALVGAWDELLDSYHDLGFEVPTNASRQLAATEVDRPRAAMLASMVDAAVFAEHPPGRQASEAAWQLLDEERAELRAESSLGERVRSALSLRSLVNHVPARRVLTQGLAIFQPKEIR